MATRQNQQECGLLRAMFGPRPDEPIAELIDIIYSFTIKYFQNSETNESKKIISTNSSFESFNEIRGVTDTAHDDTLPNITLEDSVQMKVASLEEVLSESYEKINLEQSLGMVGESLEEMLPENHENIKSENSIQIKLESLEEPVSCENIKSENSVQIKRESFEEKLHHSLNNIKAQKSYKTEAKPFIEIKQEKLEKRVSENEKHKPENSCKRISICDRNLNNEMKKSKEFTIVSKSSRSNSPGTSSEDCSYEVINLHADRSISSKLIHKKTKTKRKNEITPHKSDFPCTTCYDEYHDGHSCDKSPVNFSSSKDLTKLSSSFFEIETNSQQNSQFYVQNSKEKIETKLSTVNEEPFKERVDRKLQKLSQSFLSHQFNQMSHSRSNCKQISLKRTPLKSKYGIIKNTKYLNECEVIEFIGDLIKFNPKTSSLLKSAHKYYVITSNGAVVPFEKIGDHQR